MNNSQKNRLARLKRVRAMLERYRADWQHDAALVMAVVQMDNEITFLDHAARLTGEGTQYTTADKNAQHQLLIDKLVWLSGVLFFWAKNHNDAGLKTLCDVTPSDYQVLSAHDFTTTFRTVVEKAADLGVDTLGEYGLDADLLESYQMMAGELDSILGTPQLNRADLKALRKEVRKRFAEVRTLLTRTVRNMLISFKSQSNGLWLAYEAAMVIVDRKAGHPPSQDDVVVG
jgi:hypothetical protein